MAVGIRFDSQTGLYRWYCPSCHAGTGVSKSGDVPDRITVAQAKTVQWEPQVDAVRGMLGHRITHREHRGFMAAGAVSRAA